ncbi:DNA invertase [Mesorhizobium sp. WSM3866]|uniref:recombinase family protein n=1 Tax=Mesorhizobium sp. WSM3866 TaxID=422271 RepID=UPI000BB0993C|nr:recombinase family protein [Mesorhizobium sp. WSM3866]PBB41309.1 DNA invertase [Mesorhizobium sp. WSM3866]
MPPTRPTAPEGHLVGYARTSTTDQKAGLAAQQRDLLAAGCRKIFHEELSSVATKRPQLDAALEYVRDGDTFIVTKPDRLARSTLDLLQIAKGLEIKGVALRILSLDLNTSTPTGKLMLTVLGGIAAFERDLMLERQREGIAKAQAEGKYKGRAPTARRKSADVLRLRAEGLTADAVADRLGIGRASVFRILRADAALKRETP